MTEIKAALETDLKPEALTAVLEGWAKARLAALEEAAKAEDPKAAALILAELIGGARAALEAEGPALEGWAGGLAAELAGLAGGSRTILEGFGALGIGEKSVAPGIGALMIGGEFPIDNTFWETGGAQATAKPAPAREPAHPDASTWDVDHAIDPVSNARYNLETRPETDHETVTDGRSGHDYDIPLDTSGGGSAPQERDALEDDPEYQEAMQGGTKDPKSNIVYFEPGEGEDGYEYRDEESGEVYTVSRDQFRTLTGVDPEAPEEEDDGFGDPAPGDEPEPEPSEDAPKEDEPASGEDDEQIPVEDEGAPLKPVEPKDSTDGTTQPALAGEGGLSSLPVPDGLAPLILTDPDRDAIVFNLPPKEPGYGLTQPSPVDQGGGRPPLPAPDGGEVMDFAHGFEGPGDFLF